MIPASFSFGRFGKDVDKSTSTCYNATVIHRRRVMIHRFEAFVTGITLCYKSIQRIKSMEMTEFGLRGNHAMCLYFLLHNPQGMTASQLSKLCAEDKAAISRALADMQKLGYVTVPQGSRYRAAVCITPLGREKASSVDRMIEEWVSAGGEGLSEEEREVFYKSLSRISANLQQNLENHKEN